MSSSVTVTGVEKLTGELRKLNIEYRQSVLDAMADYLDLVRILAAKKYIIPDRHKDKCKRQKYRLQPTDSTRLTSRSGALLKMLRTGIDKWSKGPSTRTSKSIAIQGRVTTLKAGTKEENYEGKLSYNIAVPYDISKVSSKQQLQLRFAWDGPSGIRGKRRPFLSAANEELITQSALERKAKQRLQRLGLL